MSLPPWGAARLSAADIVGLHVGTWIEERLDEDTTQAKRINEVAFGRPRRITEIFHRGWSRRGTWYANVFVDFNGERAAITLVEGAVRFRVRQAKVDIFDLVKFGRAAESSHEVADL